MEALIAYVIALADKYPAVHYIVIGIGLAYVLLSALRLFLTIVCDLTKTKKDDKIIKNIFAFLDKYAYGFGKFAEYYETHPIKKEQKK